MEQVFFTFLDPDILANGIQVGHELAGEGQVPGADPVVDNDHGFLEYILGLFMIPVVMEDIALNDGETGDINEFQDL